ncbi:MAG TPA: DUF1697 domain-containing protein [Gaiellales bacterium]|nr:DUF1697 domain-containing protein [Gaiellales bacterium]
MRQIVLLRGINLGPRNRIAMPQLRKLLETAGFDDVRTYVQSGNIVLSTRRRPESTAVACEKLIGDELGLDIPVVVRTRDELAEIVRRNPLGDVADDPKRYQVSFLDGEPDPKAIEKLAAAAAGGERIEAIGREIYAWHPDGIARSKMWAALAGKGIGVKATARNWTTVTTLLHMAEDD